MICSATLCRALERFASYCRLISDSTTATLTEANNQVILQFHFDTGGTPPIYQTVDTVVASILSYMRWIANEHVVPIAVHLPHHLITGRAAHRDFYGCPVNFGERSEEHTSELQSLMRISYAVFCLKKKNKRTTSEKPQTHAI